MTLIEHAENELNHWITSDDVMSRMMADQLLDIVKIFAKHGHSGMSAAIAISVLTRLLDYKPLRPLTGEADEWIKVGTNKFQNKRCSSVFKDGADGQAYDINGNVFRDQHGCTWSSDKSAIAVEFPYTPQKAKIIDYFDLTNRSEDEGESRDQEDCSADGEERDPVIN